MGEPERRLLAAAILLVVFASCATAPQPAPQEAAAVPPQTVTPPEVAPSPPPPATEEPVATPIQRPKTVVIDPGDEPAHAEPDLVAAAQAERTRRTTAAAPVAVVDDKNLDQHAVGRLTFTDAPPPAAPGEDEVPAGDEEGYWRQRVRTDREAWAQAVEEIERLDNLAAELRMRFYAEDDPFVRDGRIKPEWDRALRELEEARQAARNAEEDLDRSLEEGRASGALPGWLREGIDLEPERREGDDRPGLQDPVVGEPNVVDEG